MIQKQNLLAVAALVCILTSAAWAQIEFMPSDEVKSGMTGTVLTTFTGVDVAKEPAEVIGIMKNVLGPKTDLILIRFTSDRLKYLGVANGMSGSPFYIDGKLVGAVSIRIGNFPKEPIAGVTPIGNMLATQFGGRGAPEGYIDYHQLWNNNASVEKLATVLGVNSEQLTGALSSSGDNNPINAIAVPLSHSGLDPRVVQRFSPVLSQAGFELGGLNAGGGEGTEIAGNIEPGMPVMLELIGGDLSLGASGTVTHIDGNRLWAFGHPMFQLGEVSVPMARAELLQFYPSLEGSFHITTTGQTIGAFTQDRATAVFGEIGTKADTLPMDIEITYRGNSIGSYHYDVARNVLITPTLVDIAISNSMLVSQRQAGELSATMKGTIKLNGQEDIKIDEFFSGFDVAGQVGGLPAAVYFFLANNDFIPVRVESIDLKIDLVEEIKMATLERAWLTRSQVKPGEQFKLYIELKPRRGRAMVLSQDYYIPPTLKEGTYYIAVGNGSAIAQNENSMVEGSFKIRDLPHMIRLINSLRPNYKLYAQTFTQGDGAYFEGDFLPNLPPSTLSVIRANKGGEPFVRLRGEVMDERRMDTEYVVLGARNLTFTVKR